MIELQHLTKVYKKGKKRITALRDVSFSLPEKGFIFVVGRSGCGKSTLLNLIGGCDRLTSGEIVVDGNAFSVLGEHDFDRFRNSYVGFVFQDHCLIEGLTVEENVALAMQLQGTDDAKEVYHALKMVELDGLGKRYPKELSGGEAQRVAIARAIVKRPRLVLADEPTGNLDAASSQIVFDLLKNISREALVLIVSHNRADAEKYADRIIELSKGCIVSDVSRDRGADDLTISKEEVVIQKGMVFSEEQIAAINAAMKDGAQLRQTDARFLPTTALLPSVAVPLPEAKKFTPRGRRMIFLRFMRRRTAGIAVTLFSVIVMTLILGVCQLFTKFSADREIARMLSNGEVPRVFAMQKGYHENEATKAISTDYFARATEEDIASFREAGYAGGVYPLYNISLMTHTEGENVITNIEKYNLPYDAKNYAAFYCGAGFGVLVTDMQFVAKFYGDKAGKLTLLSGTLETKGDEVLITDYFADSILAYNSSLKPLEGDPYQNLVGGRAHFSRYRVCGVIATGYKERYGALREKIVGSGLSALESEEYSALLEELSSTLNIAYSFNPGFYDAYCADIALDRPVYYGTYSVRCGPNAVSSRGYCTLDGSLPAGEVRVNKSLLARIWNIPEEEVTEERAIGTKLTLTRYEYHPVGAPFNYKSEVTVAGIMSGDVGDIAFSEREYALAASYGSFPYVLYFEDLSCVTELYERGTERCFAVRNPIVSAMDTVGRAADVFKGLFKIIGTLLFVLVSLTLVAFGVGSVRKNIHEIAIVRALGGRVGDLTVLFVLQMLLVGFAACLIFTGGLALGAGVCNSLLADGFVAFTGNVLIRDLNMIVFDWGTAMIDAAVILSLTALSSVAPFIMLRKAKPREILRAKD